MTLPTTLGFPNERLVSLSYSVPHYKCDVGPFSVFIYHPGGVESEPWAVERAPAGRPFFDPSGDGSRPVYYIPHELLVAQALIHDLTSEGNSLEHWERYKTHGG